jgi:hypothetical protein
MGILIVIGMLNFFVNVYLDAVAFLTHLEIGGLSSIIGSRGTQSSK